jgi:hypothetical protein
MSCSICHACVGHMCLHCNSKYDTEDEVVTHQRKRQHIGGHFILESVVTAADLHFNDTEEIDSEKIELDSDDDVSTDSDVFQNKRKQDAALSDAKRACRADMTSQSRLGADTDTPPTDALSVGHFRSLLVNSIVSANLPFSVVENAEFRELLTAGRGRERLSVPSRRTVVRAFDDVYDSVMHELKAAVAAASSRISITFDLWSDRQARGYGGVTGHFFDKDMQLRAPLLGFVFVPKSNAEGHTIERILDAVVAVLVDVLGDDWKKKVHCSVTDGAKSVTGASRQLGVSRRCFQHGLQLFSKHFCATQRDVASAMASCNYLAKLSGLSHKFRSAVGAIPAGVGTRWNSYIMTARAVLLMRNELTNYTFAVNTDRAVADLLKPHVTHLLMMSGFNLLHDMVQLLAPLTDITINEAGELYITSSSVIPQLVDAKQRIDTILAACARGDNLKGAIAQPAKVAAWAALVAKLWDTYLAGFVDDDLFLSATMVDARWQLGVSLPFDLQTKAGASLRRRIQVEFDRREQEREIAARVLAQSGGNALDRNVVDEQARVRTAAALGIAVLQVQQQARVALPPRAYNDIDTELALLFAAIANRQEPLPLDADPMQIFRDNNLQLARAVALDVLSVPSGEAPCERIRTDRSSMSHRQVTRLTFIRKNKVALNLPCCRFRDDFYFN